MPSEPIAIIGAGIGGLAAALRLAGEGLSVTVFERGPRAGGKLREITVGDRAIDSGPTVFTLKSIFERLFAAAGADFDTLVPTEKADILARHAWNEAERLDLFASLESSADAIGALAGPREAKGFLAFAAEARRTWQTLKGSFVGAPAPSMVGLVRHAGVSGLGDLLAIRPFTTLWSALGDHFTDPRLRQLFGRYSTYCGSSPFLSPATLMLVAHVEQEGVWLVEGGMYRLVEAMVTLCEQRGVVFSYDADVTAIDMERHGTATITLDSERIACSAVIFNGDASALSGLLKGSDAAVPASVAAKNRSLSAITWSLLGRPGGFPLHRHSVFFSQDYRREFDDIFRQSKSPSEPTVYVCAQDRDDRATAPHDQERLFCLVNAPADGDLRTYARDDHERAMAGMFKTLRRCGLDIHLDAEPVVTSPDAFSRMFPGSGGALYGRASHGWAASFQRPGIRTKMPNLYLAGGSVHPGPGIPMAALSGMMAAQCLVDDRHAARAASAGRSRLRKAIQ
ncbi:MAG: phytoene desaturase [Beijerinckiaceae bacterium]|nr:phytoene desaturase [Beijerinckiaceae bacterium]